MAKLLTHHDKFHSHALFGLLALLHFGWRLVQVLRYGTSFPAEESLGLQTAGVLVHFILPLLSLQLPLPQKRNPKLPMLWHEARLHSLIFSTRHVVATLCSMWSVWPNPRHFERYSAAWWSTLALEILVKQALVVATCRAAQWASDRYGDHKNRTTNAMPYPPHVDHETQLVIKEGYALAQFSATSFCLLENDPTAQFLSLVAIQGAAFIMTLVRKGFMSATTYHRVYVIQLMISIWVFTFRAFQGTPQWNLLFGIIVAHSVSRQLRFNHGYSPIECWMVGVAVHCLGWALVGGWVEQTLQQEQYRVLSQRIMIAFMLHTSVPWKQLPLFFNTSSASFRNSIFKFHFQPREAFRPSVEKGKAL